jgi:rhodanese-related sulfurtransferase
MPLADLPERLQELQKRREVVAYCRGPYCVMALDAVDLLRRKGIRARRLDQGVAEWRSQGWRVATGEERSSGGRP